MTKNLTNTLAQCLIQQLIALEFAEDDCVNPDFAIKIMESVAIELQSLGKQDAAILSGILDSLSVQIRNQEHKEFVSTFMENFKIK